MVMLSSCSVDFTDSSHDNDYILVSTYYEIDSNSNTVIKEFYVPYVNYNLSGLRYYDISEVLDLEVVALTSQVTYGMFGNYTIVSKTTPIMVYGVSTLKWKTIPENDWIYSTQRLQDDVLVTYGTLPMLSPNYELYDTVRVLYEDLNLTACYVVVKVDTRTFIRYGDLRALLI